MSTRNERDRSEHAIAQADGAGCPPRLAAALHYAMFPGGHRIRPQLCSPSRAPAATAIRMRPTPPRRRSRCCIAPRWCMTTCPASTTPISGAASLRCIFEFGEPLAVLAGDALIVLAFETLARGAGRAIPRAGLALSLVAPSGRRAARHRRRAGLGMRAERAAVRLSARQDRRPVRRRDAWPARPPRAPIPSPGARSATSSARPIRSPTICATCCATPRNSASRSARTPRGCGPTPRRSSASAAPRRGWRSWSTRRGRQRSRPAPARDELRTLIKAQTLQFFPKQLAPRRGLRPWPPWPSRARRTLRGPGRAMRSAAQPAHRRSAIPALGGALLR